VRELAPAKVNICLCVGPHRADGRHELFSVMQAITLCDELELCDGERDEVICAGVEGPNLAAAALAAFREATGWDGPAQRIEITKRIPVAAGLGGGSADAAAALRMLARRAALRDRRLLAELAATLGSDVPAALRPGRALVRGGGEQVVALPDPAGLGVLVLPSPGALSTAAVYARADQLGSCRSAEALAALALLDPRELEGVNDLEAAARSLEPGIAVSLERARAAGARHALVSGSGPTVIGLFDTPAGAAQAAAALAATGVEALAARPFPGSASAPA
jgi:4-diphosphocytidyl-2-C-methyl-D-erythritol kinase